MAHRQSLEEMLEQIVQEREGDVIEVTEEFDGMGRLLIRVRKCDIFEITDRFDEHGVMTARSMRFHRSPGPPRIAELLAAPATLALQPHPPRAARPAQATRASRRASNRAIAALPRRKFVEYAKIKAEHDAECHVCLADYEPKETLIELPCGHVYHNTCGVRWLKQSKTCPKCRAAVEG